MITCFTCKPVRATNTWKCAANGRRPTPFDICVNARQLTTVVYATDEVEMAVEDRPWSSPATG